MMTHYAPITFAGYFKGTLFLKGKNTLIALEHDRTTH